MSTKLNIQSSLVESIIDKFFEILLERDDVPREIVDKLKNKYIEGKLSNSSHVSDALKKKTGEQI